MKPYAKRFVFLAGLLLLAVSSAPAQGGGTHYIIGPPRAAKPIPGNPHPDNYIPAHKNDEVAAPRTVKIGLLVPLSGQFAPLGKAMLDAATLALFDKYDSIPKHDRTSTILIIPKDTGDSSDQAELAAREVMKEKVSIILGPVFANQVGAVVTHARQRETPIISFSNNQFIAGPGVFIFGFIPDQQVRRIATYAVTHGLTQIAAMLPSNPYGASVIKPLNEAVNDRGFSVRPISYYPDNTTSMVTPMKRLIRDIQQSTVQVKAIFIAEGGSRMPTLQTSITETKLKKLGLPLLGTGFWDNPEIIKYNAFYGGMFAAPPQESYQSFVQEFTAKHHYLPDRRASLAYDAMALATTLALNPAGPDFSVQTLTSPLGYIGPANGLFRFLQDGTNERGLSIMQITGQGFKTVDPPPESFLK